MNNSTIKRKATAKKDDLNLNDLVSIVTKNKLWFILSLFIFLSMGVGYLLVTNKIYYVDTSILLREDDGKSKSTSAMSMLSGLGDLGSMMGSKNVDNEVGVLGTRMTIKKAVNQLQLNVVSQTRKGFKTVDMYPDLPYTITVDTAQVDTIQSAIEFEIKPKNNQYEISGTYDNQEFRTIVPGFPVDLKTTINIHIDKNPLVNLDKEDQKVKITINNPNITTYSLGKELGIAATSKKTTIIKLGLETDNVKKAQDLLNVLVANFNKEAVKDKNMEANNTAAFVDERLTVISAELEVVERDVEKYKQDNNLTDIESEAKLFLDQLGESEMKRMETQIQMNMIQYLEDYVQDTKNVNKMIPTVGLEDKGLLAIIVKYNELFMEKGKLEVTSSGTNPSLLVLNNQLTSMRQNIVANINNLRGSLNVMYQDLQKQDKVMNARIKSIPRQEREYIEIARQREIKEKLFVFLLQKREEANMNLAATSPKAKIIDNPMPSIKPIAPKKMNVLGMMMILGIVVPFSIFYLQKMLKTKIESKEELERICDAKIIGEISQSKNKKHIIVKKDSGAPDVELFRLLRANLMFRIKGTDQKVILITSTIAGEGKTFIGANLAACIAFTGKKVLLVGLDIRKPRLAEYLNLPKANGITNYLSEKGSFTPEDLIQKSGIHPDLEIVQAGAVPPNPNELLMDEALDELFNYYRTKYDFIIVDTAPVGIVSDTFLIDRLSDVTLYVNRINYVHKDSVKNINKIVEDDSLKNLYVIANGINLNDKNSGYGYGYGGQSKKN